MQEATLSELLLREEGYAVFEEVEDGVLRAIGPLPGWFTEIFGATEGAVEAAQLAAKSPFLENFLVDAAEFWNAGAAERANSGTWIERGAGGREIALEAHALRLAGKKLLVIANPERQFADRVATLQTAREFTLEHERLQKEITKKEILLHCIIHDLSQPLTAMRGCLSLLGTEKLSESARPMVEIALRQSRRQEDMIRGILDAFSGELAGTQAGAKGPGTDLVRCAQEVARDYTPAFAERGARIELDPAVDRSREWWACGDAARLRRIYTNLVENALRYSPKGSVVTLGVKEEGSKLLATVDDQGPGLPEGPDAPQLFALFGKGKGSTGKAGLGLYFCKMTVERWGGEIGAARRPEGGTRFWFRLPRWQPPTGENLVSTSAETEAELKSIPANGEAAEKTTRPLRILVAEDVEVNLELTSELLKKKGHTVVAARNGAEAVEAYKRESFDVVLMDVEMPVKDGLEATREIRELEKVTRKHTRIVGLTGHATKRDHERVLAAGMDAHLSKPFDGPALWGIVAGGEQIAGAPPAPAAEGFEAQLVERVGGDRKLLATLIRLFRKECPQKLKETRKAVRTRDAHAIATTAHAMKSLVGNFGAHPAFTAARELEFMGRNGNLSGADAALASLKKRVKELDSALARMSRKLAGKKRRKA